MNHRLFLPAVLLALLPVTLFAQAEEPAIPGFARMSDEEFYVGKNTVTFGYRVLTSGAHVQFGNLGTVPSLRTVEPPSAGEVDRSYDNGYAGKDGPRVEEADSDGSQTSIPGGRFQTFQANADGTTSLVGDFLSYTPGRTRLWGYATDSQLTSRGVAMSTYSATSDGASLSNKGRPAGGVELQVSRLLGRLSRRVEWSLSAGLALNDIHNKANGTVHSTLHASTDFYGLNGLPAPAAPYSGPSYVDLTDASGTLVATNGQETTTPISSTPDSLLSTLTSTPGAAAVQGNWKLKGAYYMMRVGPSLRAMVTERLGLSASLGLAGAYAGTNYSVIEQFSVEGVADAIATTAESDKTKFLPGYYADLNAELAVTERTGFFAGVSVQSFGDYSQSVGGRTAKIDLGNSVGVRGGISIKF
jgi:hypothetical protein